MMKEKRLTVIDGETLMDARFPKCKFCIDTLLPAGISMLGGAPKIGKSWMVLDLCLHIAKGEPIWGFDTMRGTVLYLALEDSLGRIQARMNRLTDEAPSNLYFAVSASTVSDGLHEQIRNFVSDHTDTVLVAIDTFQLIRNTGIETSYANDYEEVRQLKRLADELQISLLLVHHLRKQGDSDPLNKLSGTTGISGAMDAVLVLDVSKRNAGGATLFCTGRDIECRELELNMSRDTCVWELVSDSLEKPEMKLPRALEQLIDFMKATVSFSGGNTEFAEQYNAYTGESISAKSLKQMMNRWRYPLEDAHVYFKSSRSNGQRLIEVNYSPPSADPNSDASAVSDAEDGSAKICVPSVPCVPA